jgi:DNA topoisomerase-3
LTDGKVEFIFPDFNGQLDVDEIKKTEPLGLSPTDQTPVFDTPTAYMSVSAMEGDQKKGLRISKMILGRRIEQDHIVQLLDSGKTELITGFTSKRKKPFDAYLLLDDQGKITFEFPPRKRKGGTQKNNSA